MAEITSGKLALTLIELHEQPTPFQVTPDVFIEDDFDAVTLDSIWTLNPGIGGGLQSANSRVKLSQEGSASDNGFLRYNVNDLPANPSYWRGEYNLGLGGNAAVGTRWELTWYGSNSNFPGGGIRLHLGHQSGNFELRYNDVDQVTGPLSMGLGNHVIVVEYDGSAVRFWHNSVLKAEWASGPLSFPVSAGQNSIVISSHHDSASSDHYVNYTKFEVVA